MVIYYITLAAKILSVIAATALYTAAFYAENSNRHSFDMFKRDVKNTALVLLIVSLIALLV